MTREEAIKIIKSATVYTPEEMEALETIIPELRESEDERMMREFNDWLCEEIECRTNDLRDEKDRRTLNMLCYVLTKVKDWLEKQKEPHYTKRNALFDKCVENCDPKVMKEVSDKVDEMLGKEQKPEHLELKAGHWYICHRAFCCRADHLTVKEGERFQCEKDGIVKGFIIKEPEKYFKECSAPAPMEDEQKEQKPAEWSEEDERMLSRCVKSIEASKQFADSDTFKLAKDKEIVWLENRFKFLSPQPKQELSEEEFETFRKTLAKDAFLDEITSTRVAKKLLNSVKSLSPSWKPTECQMDSLKEIADSLPKGSNLEYLEEVIHGLDILTNNYSYYKSAQENNWKPSEE